MTITRENYYGGVRYVEGYCDSTETSALPSDVATGSHFLIVDTGDYKYYQNENDGWVDVSGSGGGGGGSSTTIEALSITQNGTTTAPAGTAYSPVTVNVPNSYTASDEGKVVSNGALVAQTSHATVTQNGTIDTTLNNSVEVAVSADPNPTAEEADVNFIDFDGTIRYSYSAADFANLTELPANPTHDGLTAQGWNWTLADAKAYVANYQSLWIGQMYITDDGKTRLYISLPPGRTSPMISFGLNGTAVIDWGDNSENTTVTGTSLNGRSTATHVYSTYGDYVIAIAITGSARFNGSSTSSGSSYIMSANSSADNTQPNPLYRNALMHIEVGENMKFNSYGLKRCQGLETVTIPNGVAIDDRCFYLCSMLKSITLAGGANDDTQQAFESTSLHTISAMKNSPISNNMLSDTYITAISLPEVTTINTSILSGALSLGKIVIPTAATTIAANAFYNTGLGEVRFTGTTPPTVSNSSAFSSIATDCKIYVPYSALAAYLTATNYPSASTYTYLGFATYPSGATLPTQDTTAAYNVTWYATKADALAGTNPITQGNGNEVYCTYAAV